MRWVTRLALAALVAPAAPRLAAQSGAFIVRLGSDTVFVEQYSRTADRLEGDQVSRTARQTTLRHFTAAFDARGRMTSYELAGRPAASPDAVPERASARFVADTAIVEVTIGDSTRSAHIPVPVGTIPYVGLSFALVELLTQAAQGAGGTAFSDMLPLGATAPFMASITHVSADSLAIVFGDGNPVKVKVDPQGRVLGATGRGTTQQVTVERVPAVDIPAVAAAFARRPLDQGTESGAFVVRLGRDTLAIEQFTRSATAIDGQQVVRVGQTVHRVYHVDLAPDGSVRRFELAIHRVTQPGAKEQRASIEFSGDSATVRAPRQDSVLVTRLAVARGAVPWISQSYALVEHAARLARAAGGDRFASQAIPAGGDPLAVTITRGAADTLSVLIGEIGPVRVRVDASGRLLGGTGLGSTAQVDIERVASLDMNALGKSFAARPLGTLSPLDSMRVTIAGATLGVKYGRPAMRGRVIFGTIVPWGKVWRTGANEATVLTTSADLDVAGTTIPAGAYSLWTIPTPQGWTLIVNRNTGQWGTQYDSTHDFVRLPMTVERLARPVERFTIAIEPQAAGGVLRLEWETTRASIPFTKK